MNFTPPNWTKRLQRETVRPFDFVITTDAAACVSRLGSLQDLREHDAWAPRLSVDINMTDAGGRAYTFSIREHEPAPVRIHGTLHQLDDGATYVSGAAVTQVFLGMGEIAALLLLIGALSSFVGPFVMVLFLPPLGVFTWYYWRGAHRERDRLLADMRATLGRRES